MMINPDDTKKLLYVSNFDRDDAIKMLVEITRRFNSRNKKPKDKNQSLSLTQWGAALSLRFTPLTLA